MKNAGLTIGRATNEREAMKHLLCLTVLACLVAASNAETITVCLDGSCDYTDIQEAINAASDGDVIEIAADSYLPSETLDTQGRPITLRGAIDGEGGPATIIDGQGAIGVLQCTGGEETGTVFENLLITNGYADTGGGLYCSNGSPVVRNCMFLLNSAVKYYGGGVYCLDSSPVFAGCVFQQNSAYYDGGGVYCKNSSLTMDECVFRQNVFTEYGGYGGGMYCGNSVLVLDNCVFMQNSLPVNGGYGGGMCSIGSTLALANCVFQENSAIFGGGLYCPNGSLAVSGCVFQGNSISFFWGKGGGVYCSNSNPSMINTILCSNTPDQVYGAFADGGGNCLAFSCLDADEDGIPDKCGDTSYDILNVPSGEYPTIASAIVSAGYGDIIEIAPGTYFPEGPIDTGGKPITIRGAVDAEGNPATIIDGQEAIGVLRFTNSENPNTVLENLVITGGQASWGGGMYCGGSNPSLTNCVFRENSAEYGGGGIYCTDNSNPNFTNCVCQENTVSSSWGMGGDMYCSYNSSPVLDNCNFADCCTINPPASFIDKGGNLFAGQPYVACEDCRADVDCNGTIDAADLGLLLAAWNTSEIQYDLDGDGVVAGGDLGLLLGTWGVCQ